jgi:hypothetical protein
MTDIRRFALFFNVSGQHIGTPVAVDDPEIFEMQIPPGTAGVEFFDREPKGAKPIDTIHFVTDIFSRDRADDYSETYARNLRQRNMPIGLLLMNGPGTNRLLTPVPGAKYFVLNTRREFIMPPDCKVAPTVAERSRDTGDEPQPAFRRAVDPPPAPPQQPDYSRIIEPQIVPVSQETPQKKKPELPPSMIIIPN